MWPRYLTGKAEPGLDGCTCCGLLMASLVHAARSRENRVISDTSASPFTRIGKICATFAPQLLKFRGWASKGIVMHRILRLDPSSTHLLMIDFQERHRCDPVVMAHGYGDVLLRASMVLAAARRAGVAVVHSGQTRDTGQGDEVPLSPLAQFSPETAAQWDEPALIRHQPSAFSSPDLAAILRDRDCETLMIAGVWTEATVAATVRDAVAAGLRVLIVKDACASGSELMHRTATLNLGNRLHGGGILDAIRAADLLSGQPARVWMLEEVVPFQYIPETVAPLYNAL